MSSHEVIYVLIPLLTGGGFILGVVAAIITFHVSEYLSDREEKKYEREFSGGDADKS